MKEGILLIVAKKNTNVACWFTGLQQPRYASAEAASALPGFLCFVKRHTLWCNRSLRVHSGKCFGGVAGKSPIEGAEKYRRA